MNKWIASLFVMVFLLVIFLSNEAVAADCTSSITTCCTINAAGNYVIANNIGTTTNPCIIINASDVVLDGQNYTMTLGASNHKFFEGNGAVRNNITIKNIKATDGGAGGWYLFYLSLNNSRYENVNVTGVDGPVYGLFYSHLGSTNVSFNNIYVEAFDDSNDNFYMFYGSYTSCSMNNSNLTWASSGTSRQMFQQAWYNSSFTNNIFKINTPNYMFASAAVLYGMNFTNNTFHQTANAYIFRQQTANITNCNFINNTFIKNESVLRVYFETSTGNFNNALFYNNKFQTNATGGGLFYWASPSSFVPDMNTTKQTGVNIIGGLNIGGNYYWNSNGSGFSETCLDTDNDFICDNSYTITTGITDYLPLVSNVTVLSIDYNDEALEWTNQEFNLTLDYNPNLINNITANITYNGTTYTSTSTNDSDTWNFTSSFRIDEITATYNETRDFYWAYTAYYVGGGSETHVTNTYNQTVHKAKITEGSGPTPTIRFYCFDENGTAINCDLDITFTSWAPENYGDTNYDRSDHHTPTGANNYVFYKWNDLDFWDDISVYYSATGYPTRYQFLENITLNSTLQNYNLYLLPTADGIYVTFQVLSPTYSPLQDVFVNASRDIGGTDTLVGTGYTDAAGTITFWLNPNYPHTFYFIADGYSPYTTTITPTQSSYTIIMSGGGETNNTPIYGMNYEFTPPFTTILQNNTEYNFTFTLSTANCSLDSFGFNLTDSNGTVYTTNTSTSPVGGSLSSALNTSLNTSILIVYYWNTTECGGTYTGIAEWKVIYSYQGNYSIATFFDDLIIFSESPEFGGMGAFTLALIAFVVILLLTGVISYTSGIYSPIAIGGLITGLTWAFTFVGLIKSPTTANITYLPAVIVSLLYISYIIYEQIK